MRPKRKQAIAKRCTATQRAQVKREKTQALQKALAQVEQEMRQCVGPDQILKFKTLRRRQDKLTRELETAVSGSQVDQARKKVLAKMQKTGVQSQYKRLKMERKTPTRYRLLPPPPEDVVNMFDTMTERDITRWKQRRCHEKRFQLMYGDKLRPDHSGVRTNSVDQCPKCRLDRVVDKEHSIMSCPGCGETKRFAAHIFEVKEYDREDNGANRQQSLNHMQKFSYQFERGYPFATPETLESLTTAYNHRYHYRDANKVQACRTADFMRDLDKSASQKSGLLQGLSKVPRSCRRAPDRLSKELKREAIPEFTSQEVSQLLNQRNRLRQGEQADHHSQLDDHKHKKSYNNQVFLRQFSRANQMEQGRLFTHAKTTKIHVNRMRSLEKLMLKHSQDTVHTQKASQVSWEMYPNM